MRFRRPNGQSSLELAAIGILVVLGIIIGGPYVLRSIKAQFKLWDQAVQDSQNDHLIQADKDQIDIDLPPCECEWRAESGMSGCGASGCKKTERLYSKSCTPLGCDHGFKCEADDLCCTTPVRQPQCWRKAADTPKLNPAPSGSDDFSFSFHIPCTKYDRISLITCGANKNMEVCSKDVTTTDRDPNCTPACQTGVLPRDANGLLPAPCPLAGDDLADDIDAILVTTCPDPPRPTYCDYHCVAPYVNVGGVCTLCGNGQCDAGEACGCDNCRTVDPRCPPVDPCAICDKHDEQRMAPGGGTDVAVSWYMVTVYSPECPESCKDAVTVIPDITPGSTPILFTYTQGQYRIENDVLETYKDPLFENAKYGYENDSGIKRVARQSDYYRLRLNPDVTDEGVKLQIRELEPEESHIDQVRLLRVVHPKGSYAFVDEQTVTIKTIGTVTQVPLLACQMNGADDCAKALGKTDDLSIDGKTKDSVILSFNISGLDRNNLYLTVNSWQGVPIGVIPAPFKAAASANGSTSGAAGADGAGSAGGWSLNIDLIDSNVPGKVLFAFNDIHPRDIAMPTSIALGDALKAVTGNTVTVRITWTAQHFVDYVGIISAPAVEHTVEELALKSASFNGSQDAFGPLSTKDKVYTHTVRGDQVDLVFAKPTSALKADEGETYFFLSSGFYHALRMELHPNADPSHETFKKELQQHVDELNAFLKTQR